MQGKMKDSIRSIYRRLDNKWLRKNIKKIRLSDRPSEKIGASFLDKKLNLGQHEKYLNGISYNAPKKEALEIVAREEWSNFIIDQLCQAQNNLISHRELTSNVIAKAQVANSEECNYKYWLEISRSLLYTGFLEAAGKLRDMAIASVLSDKHKENNVEPLPIFQAALEVGDLDTALEFEKQIRSKLSSEETLFFRLLIYTLKGSTEDFEQELHFLCKQDSSLTSLLNYVQDKSVAIVGPCNTEIDCSQEIDDCDIVIRNRFISEDDLPFGSGKKTSVAFYTHEHLRILRNSDLSKEILQSLDFVVLRDHNDLPNLVRLGQPKKSISISFPLQSLFFASTPNAIPRIVSNIILLKPKNVKIFKSNLFLNPTYPRSYLEGKSYINLSTGGGRKHPSKLCKMFARFHDPLAQLRFLKKIKDVGLIKGDDEFMSIVELSDPEYMRQLDDVYGQSKWALSEIFTF